MRKLKSFFLLLLFILTNASAQKATDYRKTTELQRMGYTSPPNLTMISSRRKKPNSLVTTCYSINKRLRLAQEYLYAYQN